MGKDTRTAWGQEFDKNLKLGSENRKLKKESQKLRDALTQILGWRELRSGNEFPIERIEDIAREALYEDKN